MEVYGKTITGLGPAFAVRDYRIVRTIAARDYGIVTQRMPDLLLLAIIALLNLEGQNFGISFDLRFNEMIASLYYQYRIILHRGSYMSAHYLLNLLNESGKRDKMRGLPSIISLFRNEFNKFNNTTARMLDSINHMTNTLKSHFWSKNVIILSLHVRNVVMDVITFLVNL